MEREKIIEYLKTKRSQTCKQLTAKVNPAYNDYTFYGKYDGKDFIIISSDVKNENDIDKILEGSLTDYIFDILNRYDISYWTKDDYLFVRKKVNTTKKHVLLLLEFSQSPKVYFKQLN